MLQTEIRREKLATIFDEELPDLSAEAEALLGYKPPAVETLKPNPLADALARLEIEVLDWRDVLTYQLERRQERECEELSRMKTADIAPSVWQRHRTAWAEVELSKYTGAVPIHVLNKALEIKRFLPEVEFYIEHLSETPDPFLVAKLANSSGYSWEGFSYYIDVWDEPKFERR